MRNYPALILGLILFAYWARVIRLTLKARRRSGRAGNFIPTERLGRWLRLIWNPVVVAWIALPLAVAFRGQRLPDLLRPYPLHPALTWSALAVAVLAFIATLICWKRMGKSWRMGIDPGEKTQLVLSGPYAYVRHPIYGLSSLLMICSLVIVPSAAMALLALLHLALLQWEARREERYLTQVHGPVYADYAAHTGRFVPIRLSPYVPPASDSSSPSSS
jgi:protein-S-isoprenylcysteine O-methyltransferase Ste14